MKPTFFMLVGLPYSGKSFQAEKLQEAYDAVIHSSDNIRAELLGDMENQSNNTLVFDTLHERIISDLINGKNVVYDATNINYKRRMDTLQRLRKIECVKVCVFMATPFDMCVERSKHRKRVVPYDVLERMYRNIWIPNTYEGWDYVDLIYPEGFKTRDANELFDGISGLKYISHDNPHHIHTVGYHCLAARNLLNNESDTLQEAAVLHDIGKPFTKSFVNSKGETTEVAHYYDHQHVSAYDSLFYANPELDRVYIAAVIQWHMRPYELERTESDKAVSKFRKLVGEELYTDIMKLHLADIHAKDVVFETKGE